MRKKPPRVLVKLRAALVKKSDRPNAYHMKCIYSSLSFFFCQCADFHLAVCNGQEIRAIPGDGHYSSCDFCRNE